jgi:hypothetical protein
MTTETLEIEFPARRPAGCPFDPPQELSALGGRPVRVVLWDGQVAWLFTRYEDVRAVLEDPRFSSDALDPRFPHESPSMKERSMGRQLVIMDPPEHTVLRRLLARNFVIRRLDQMRPRIQGIVDELIDDLLVGEQPVDLVEHFAFPLPAAVVSGFLGIPYEDRYLLAKLQATQSDAATTEAEAKANFAAFLTYIDQIVTDKEAHRGDDVISKLVTEQVDNATLTRTEVIANIRLLLAAAFDSTASQIALGVLLLLIHEDQRALLQADPTTIGPAVEEILRYITTDQYGRRRLATEDVEIGGALVRAGEGVIVSQSTANRDSAIFTNADRFDITRTDARDHLTFSHGIHQCLGQALARIEMQYAINGLFQRIPSLQLATPLHNISFKDQQSVYTIAHLPVTWDHSTTQPTTPEQTTD